MRPVVRFRRDPTNKHEIEVARRHCFVAEYLHEIPKESLVFARYSALPYYREVEVELAAKGCRLVNSFSQHRFVADLDNWYPTLEGLTPRSWRYDDFVREHALGEPFPQNGVVLKGETNSRKFLWDTHMRATSFEQTVEVAGRLWDDALLTSQNIWVREFVPLTAFDTGPHGLPITEEYRFFVLDGRIITGGFYWSSHAESVGFRTDPHRVPAEFLSAVLSRIGDKCRFYTIDVARKALPWAARGEPNEWTVIELNDGQMAGPSECDLDAIYAAIAEAR